MDHLERVVGVEPTSEDWKSPAQPLYHTRDYYTYDFGCGGRIRTYDLWGMNPTSYQTAPLRDKLGALYLTRTDDLSLTRRLLYQLS